ncbi:type VII secretion-associated serine protease mycosin [Saccharomonospora xinjiangensis]|uniref:type VII secretion-associated serine protease mycosin n=1 Tax=Saccharomonospora xinjiangensis TaxID=75294 RepID=UPI00106FAC8E|nr:type VII secretion-associated serine protease mycosin [Saccharomonospora xinjiangensis]QBQ58873.1 Thermophilic serine proteinase precursor [Saccharomonospora xinjiangensis]
MRSARTTKRHRASALAAAIGIAGSSLAPLPAWAQDDAASQDTGQYQATPPEVDPGRLPADDGQPDKTYEQKRGCVERNLEYNEDIENAPWGQQYLRIDEVHALMRSTTGHVGRDVETGEPIKVAVIDTGVRNHDFFKHDVQGVGDYVKRDDRGLEDCDGHGTEVAGIIAADTPDNIGFAGVAPDVQILSIRQSSQNYAPKDEGSGGGGSPRGTGPAQDGRTQGSEGAGTLGTLAKAVVRAANSGAQVINISINNCRPGDGGITGDEQALQAAIHYAVNDKDVVVVSAAGNVSESTNCKQNDQALAEKPKTIVTPPWFAENVLSVAAIDETGGVADFSMHGPWVSVAAPGTGIISLDPAEGSDGLANMMMDGGEAQEIKGTSFAAPYVTGLAALVRAKYPKLNAHQVMHRIKFTAQHPAAAGGHDNFVGFGVIDPMAALTATVPSEEGILPAKAEDLPSDMPPASYRDWTPMTVALTGAGGALAALVITLFVVHTIRRSRKEGDKPTRS